MARQRVRCRNPQCGTYSVAHREAQADDMTLAGPLKGIVVALSFAVFCIAGILGLLAMTSSLSWAVCSWGAGGLIISLLVGAGRRLDAATIVRYRYTCALCGKVWGDMPADETEIDPVREREAVAA